MRPSLLVFVALASEPCPPPGQTAARRRTPVASTSVGGRLSRLRAGFWCQILRTGGKGFLLAQERASCGFSCFVVTAVPTPLPCPSRFQANAGVAGVVGRGRVIRKCIAAAAGRQHKFFVVSVFLPRCLAHALPIPYSSYYLSPTQQWREPQAAG